MKVFSYTKFGIFLIVLSVMLLIAATASSLYHYTTDPDEYTDLQVNMGMWGNISVNAYGLNGPGARDLRPSVAAHPDAAKLSPQDVSDLPMSMAPEEVFPYSWFTVPLATIGIIALVSGVYLYRKGEWLRASEDRQRLKYWSAKK